MRLYHWTYFIFSRSIIIVFLSGAIVGCIAPRVTQELITINIIADKKDIQIKIASGSTVQEALKSTQIALGEIDRVDPPLYSVLSDGTQVKVIRVREEYYVEQEIIPFEHQELRNEALPKGDRRLSQRGVNGLEEITYQRVFEDGVEVSNDAVKSSIILEPIPEIVMVGSHTSFESMDIPGRIAYLSAGNAWFIDNNTGNRNLIVSTGDLDGRIFTLSTDGKFLLYSRFSKEEYLINSLWIAMLENTPYRLIDINVRNVVHFADFDPNSNVVAYSTAEWRETAPGWQANNDLFELTIDESGIVGLPKVDIESNSGGIYGWWGMEFTWAPDAESLLYSRPDGIGIYKISNSLLSSIYKITPYQTGGNWAWVPGTAWSPNGNVIYTVDHVLTESSRSEGQDKFDLIAIPLTGGSPVRLIENVGMFAYPIPSPIQHVENFTTSSSNISQSQESFSVAYLQAIFPDQSDMSGYRLSIIDRDGSNQKYIFPDEGALGLKPQQVVWSPEPMSSEGNYSIAFVYNGNIWLVDSFSGEAQQITGDGLTSHLDWR